MQDFILKMFANKEAKKKMSPTNARAFNTMRQRLKKHNVQYQEQIDKYRENPASTEEEASADSDADDDSAESESDASEPGMSYHCLPMQCPVCSMACMYVSMATPGANRQVLREPRIHSRGGFSQL